MKRLLALLAAGLALSAFLQPAEKPRRPDVVLILIDTLRKDHLPFHGYAKDTAPFLAGIAARGTLFDNAYSTSAWTAPAAASLFTSLYPFQHGVVYGRAAVKEMREQGFAVRLNRIPEAAETIAEAMKRAGYFTCAVSENVNVSPEMGFGQGFDSFELLKSTTEGEDILAQLERLKPRLLGRRPYFLYLHFMDTHDPYDEHLPLFDASLVGDARLVSAYDSEIHYVDKLLQRAFTSFGWAEGTLLLVTADHGEELGDHGRWGHAQTLYAEILNVPLLAFGPSIPAGRRIPERVSHVDVLPTLRESVGLAPGQDTGWSLLPLLRGEKHFARRALFADLSPKPKAQRQLRLKATVKGSWKYVEGSRQGPMLFNLDADPRDLDNRVLDHPRLIRELRRLFNQGESRSRRLAPEFHETLQDRRTNEELRALGYVN